MVDHLTVCLISSRFCLMVNTDLGAGTLAGTKGERQPSELELQIAQTQGAEFGKLVLKLNSTTTHS